jgi:YaiO family outer membrane protein
MPADASPPAIVCVAESEAAASALQNAAAARMAGDYATARRAAMAAACDNPQNADAWLELGLTDSAAGETARARETFLFVLEIAPEYDDARLGLARLDYRSGDTHGAGLWLDRISAERAHDPEVVELRRLLAPQAQRSRGEWRLDAFFAYSSLSNDLPPWREAAMSLTHRDGARSYGAALEHAERFDRSDLYGEVRFHQGERDFIWGVVLGGAADPNFKPETSVRVEASTLEEQTTTFGGSLTLARYAVGQVNKVDLRAGQQVTKALRVSAQGVILSDEADAIRTGYGVGASWRITDRLSLSLSWADAPETSEGVTVDVRSIALGLSAEISPGLNVRIGALREDREAYDRNELSLAIARAF